MTKHVGEATEQACTALQSYEEAINHALDDLLTRLARLERRVATLERIQLQRLPMCVQQHETAAGQEEG